MGAYDLKQIITLWETERLTSEQAIGQILLQLQLLSEEMNTLQAQVRHVRRYDINKLLIDREN
jgi:hypothetical protein